MDAKAADKQGVSHVSPPRHVTETPATCGEQSEGVETGVEAVHAPGVRESGSGTYSPCGKCGWLRLPGDPPCACRVAGKSATGGETAPSVFDGRDLTRDDRWWMSRRVKARNVERWGL
jgi:hypothetical protein